MNRHDRLFGSPEATADFIIRNCPRDCLSCPFSSGPCYRLGYLDEDDGSLRAKILDYLNMELIEPCPHCGQKAYVVADIGFDTTFYTVGCLTRDCDRSIDVDGLHTFTNENLAIQDWNRRASQ